MIRPTSRAPRPRRPTLYQEKAVEYGLDEEFVTRNFAQQGFTLVMSMVQRAAEVAAAGDQVDGTTLADGLRRDGGRAAVRQLADLLRLGAASRTSRCATATSTSRSGTVRSRQPVIENYYAMDLLDGTEIRTEPVD